MPATKLEPGSNQPGDTAILGSGQRALVVVLANDDGSLPSGQPTIGAAAGSGYPAGATVVGASSGNVAAAVAAATIAAGGATKRSYLTGFDFTSAGATAASVVTGTITGAAGGTRSFTVPVVAGVTLGNEPVRMTFNPPLPAAALNSAITVSVPSLGAGNTNATMNTYGYQA